MKNRTVIEKGVMAIKDGKAWGNCTTPDGRTYRGWGDILDGYIANPKYAEIPEDLTYERDRMRVELSSATLTKVTKTTTYTVEIEDE